MPGTEEFRVAIWGARGSVATPEHGGGRYGGQTPCVEMRCGGKVLVFDAGSGIRALGRRLAARGGGDLDVFLGHCHYDHVEGLRFFAPLMDPRFEVRVRSGHLDGPDATRGIVAGLMRRPFFPVGPEIFRARTAYVDFAPGDALDLGDGVTVSTARLSHPGGACGFRIDFGGRSACYLVDHEHGDPTVDAALETFARGADLAICDATYCDEDYARHRGFGHSSWQECLRFAERAGVGRCVLFHHHADADDGRLDAVAAAAEAMRPGSVVAREGMELAL